MCIFFIFGEVSYFLQYVKKWRYFFSLRQKVHARVAYTKFFLYLCPLFCVLAKMSMVRNLWNNYRSEVLFGLILAVLIGASTYLSRFITDRVFDDILTPAMNVGTIAVAFVCAWIIYRHSDGMRIRRLWGHALMLWGLENLFYLICYIVAPMQVMNMSAPRLTSAELLFGNLLGWLMTLYPTETLRPGWLNGKIVAWQILPMMGLVLLDYLIPYDLWPLIALYPYGLLVIVLTHIRAYRIWCENNYSSMEHIDAQWVIRYCIMLFFIGVNYVYINISQDHTRAFTQEWFVIFMLAYSSEQILFRKDPWDNSLPIDERSCGEDLPDREAQTANARLLEQWLEEEKPYLNPNFKLMDLMQVLPMNRTYLSQFINDTYNCSFYQFVNRYRVEDAKRLMQQNPEMKIAEVASLSGFSSQAALSRVFSKETGMTPRDWLKQM